MKPFIAGNKVRTIAPTTDATVTASRQDTKWGVLSEVTEVLPVQDGQMPRYRVKHPDGTTAEYAQNELMRVLM